MDSSLIGSKIAKARKAINISQAQLAQILFISPQAVGKWERGESIPDLITFNRLAEILGVDLNYFSENFNSAGDESSSSQPLKKINDTKQMEHGNANDSLSPDKPLLTNFSGSSLYETDFAGVTAHKSKFNGSMLRGSTFEAADLTGSSFMGSDVREANFTATNLTDCIVSASNFTDANFYRTILVRTEFKASELTRAKFSDADLIEVKLTATDLRKTIFENCRFNGVNFKSSDMSGLCLDGQAFTGVKFDNALLNETSFKGSTFKNVSFRPTFALTNRYYKTLKTICFDGAMMDKLTYAALKGVGVDLSKVATI